MLCLDVGSTYTKGALIDPDTAGLIDTCSVPTTLASDVWDGVTQVREEMAQRWRHTPHLHDAAAVRICSSAGGGLRLAVVGFEHDVTALAGRAVALSAGAVVVHTTSGKLGASDVTALSAARPDVILLVGGTDGGNADTVLRNAGVLALARLPAAVVVAGNRDAQEQACQIIADAGCPVIAAENVLPRIGTLSPTSARAAIRTAFLQHVIGGKHLSAGPHFAGAVRAATPDAVLDGIQVLRDVSEHDVMMIDIGGATTDVYSAVQPQGEDATLRKDVVGTLWTARTVEGDLGMRHSAPGVLSAAHAEGITGTDDPHVRAWAEEVSRAPHRIATTERERRNDLRIATMAAVVAARRHARPAQPSATPRPLMDVTSLIGSGGVLRYADPPQALQVLAQVTGDVGGGWRPPERARTRVDTAYLLCAIGLLAGEWPEVARGLARRLVPDVHA
ncbi:MAG: glutamate mutase L [Ornithinimicrobium sp.]